MLLRYILKALKFGYFQTSLLTCWIITYIKFKMNGVTFSTDYIARGVPIVNVNLKGSLFVGRKFSMNSGRYHNMIGRQQQCYFIVGPGAAIVIGNNVGMSCTAIVSHCSITIEDDVRIGGGCVIYDTDFHPLSVSQRLTHVDHRKNTKVKPVLIKQGAFLGAHSAILKGVTIGRHSIVGAGSVVTRSIPDNEIWAGNPAKFIRAIDED